MKFVANRRDINDIKNKERDLRTTASRCNAVQSPASVRPKEDYLITTGLNKEIDNLERRYSKSGLSEIEKLRLVRIIVRANEKPIVGPTQKRVPEHYLALAEIENSLANRMWAGFGSAELAAQILRDAGEIGKRGSGFGPRRARVAATLEKAFLSGQLTLYVAADLTRFAVLPRWAKNPMPVPKELIGHVFIKVRGRMPGNFAMPEPNLVRNERLFALLNGGQLVVREGEFRRWVRSQRKKRRWPSQQKAQCSKNPVGRPSKLTVQLKGAILDIIGQQAWHGKRPLAARIVCLSSEVWLHRASIRLAG